MLCGLLYLFTVYLPRVDAIVSLNVTKRGLVAGRDKRQAMADNLPAFLKREEDLRAAIDKTRTQLPDRWNRAEYEMSLGEAATRAGVTKLNLTGKRRQDYGFYGWQDLTLSFEGTADAAGKFLEHLDNEPRIVSFDTLAIDRSGEILVVRAELRAYHFIPTRS